MKHTLTVLTALLLAPLAALHAADAGGPVRSFDPELWVSPDGWLFDFWAQREKGRREAELGVWCIEMMRTRCRAAVSVLVHAFFPDSLSISSQPCLVEPPSAAGSVPR